MIGFGGGGKVFEGMWNGQMVAVKRIPMPSKMNDVRKEIALMSVLRHENVVNCLGTFETEDYIFILVELFKRGNLFDFVTSNLRHGRGTCGQNIFDLQ